MKLWSSLLFLLLVEIPHSGCQTVSAGGGTSVVGGPVGTSGGGAGTTGPQGLSAYQVAVNGGYSGTQAQWLASLQGPAGLSAYQVAVNGGYSGTQAQWLASLQGPAGNNGVAGLSAYQVAVSGGYSGTQAQWLASLQGAAGNNGAAGLSAYQVAVNGGYSGTQAQWLASLQGAPGANGASISPPSAYSSSTTYPQYALVTAGTGAAATVYQSQTNANTGNPVTDSSHWLPFSVAAGAASAAQAASLPIVGGTATGPILAPSFQSTDGLNNSSDIVGLGSSGDSTIPPGQAGRAVRAYSNALGGEAINQNNTGLGLICNGIVGGCLPNTAIPPNQVIAGPASGSTSGVPGPRYLVAADRYATPIAPGSYGQNGVITPGTAPNTLYETFDAQGYPSGISTVALGSGASYSVGTSGASIALLNGNNNSSGSNIFSAAGAASTPAVTINGSPYAGGTATTTKPLLLVEPSGATSAAWSTSGTMFGVNAASGFGGNLIDFQLNGSSKFSLNAGGNLNIAGAVTSGNYLKGVGLVQVINKYTAAVTLGANNYAVLSDASTAAFTVTLPLAPLVGQVYVVKKIDSSANAVTISANGGTIDGSSTQQITTQYGMLRLICYTGTSGSAVWYVF